MTLTTFADAERVLAENLTGYKARPQQQRLAGSVEDVLNGGVAVPLLAQAGCGVGKSLGGVIPAILARKEDPETGQMVPMRVIVATATKALQEQYANKDMPFLEEFLGVPFTWALLKGRSNYVCQAKVAELTVQELPTLPALIEELTDTTHSGDFEHLATEVPAERQYLLSMSSNECPGKEACPFAKECFAEKAKEVAKNSQIVITNTAMLMTELRIQELSGGMTRMLGFYDAVLIDEAHETGEIAANSLADQFRLLGVQRLGSQIEGFLNFHKAAPAKEVREMLEAAEQVWAHLDQFNSAQQVELTISEIEANVEPYITLVESARMLANVLGDTQIRSGVLKREATTQSRLIKLCLSLASKLTEFLTSDDLVRWVETDEVRRGRRIEKITILKYSPVDVGPFLNRWLWSRVPTVLVSATLTVNGSFDYIAESLGLRSPLTLDVGTPFDYSTQARMFVPDKNQPNPSKDRSAWLSYAQQTTLELVRTAEGGALLLYTSRQAMKDAYVMLADLLEMAGYTCLMQGEHGTNKEIAKRFEEDTHSVLFALKSFFTGVDFAGETCRLVVIDKLPFPVPSDIMFAAKARLTERKYGPRTSFDRLSIPMMTLTLVQGVGRLIRSVEDRGMVAILDPRLTSTGYGRKIVAGLPPMPIVSQIAAVRDFYQAA